VTPSYKNGENKKNGKMVKKRKKNVTDAKKCFVQKKQ
jgi:hypothetical protein